MAKNDYWDYIDNGNPYDNSLMHYGVLGMKWGHHKAKQYEMDMARMRYNKKMEGKEHYDAAASNAYNAAKKRIKAKYKNLSKNKPIKGQSVESLYSKQKEEAEQMGGKSYKAARAARTAGKGLMALGGATMAKQLIPRTTTNPETYKRQDKFAIGAETLGLGTLINAGAMDYVIPESIEKKKAHS